MNDLSADRVINAVPAIEGKTYLELGVAGRATFDNVKAGRKVGVDIAGGPDLQAMTTDSFYETIAEALGPFDVIYIDADHTFAQACADYNNSIKHLAPGGLIFLHDMWPPNAEYTAPIWCGDTYKLLVGLTEGMSGIVVLDHNYGLTAVSDPQLVDPDGYWAEMSYGEFLARGIIRVNGETMLAWVGSRGLST